MPSSYTWLSSLEIKEICCIGAGFVGGSTGAVLASQLHDTNVTVVDIDEARIDAWNSDMLPIFEPRLDELVKMSRGLKSTAFLQTSESVTPQPQQNIPIVFSGCHTPTSGNLSFTTDVDGSIRKADLIFVCVDTPSKTTDQCVGRALDTKSLCSAVKRVGEVAVKNFILVEKCTVPCGTAQNIKDILQRTVRSGIEFEVLSNPEFLAEGTAVQDLLHPSRILIGSFPTEPGTSAALKLASVYERWTPRDRILTVDMWSSELSKVAANALLAQRISSINSLSMICEGVNADIRKVAKACGLDDRIGSHMLNASVGFGGSCFHKDVSYLVYLAHSLGFEQVARYWQGVLEINEEQQDRFGERAARRLCSLDLAGSRIAVLGFAFKANTNDTRNSAAIRMVNDLSLRGFQVAIYDPCVSNADIISALSGGSGDAPRRVGVFHSSYEACIGAHAIMVLTEWSGFRYPVPSSGIDTGATYEAELSPSNSLKSCKMVDHDSNMLGRTHSFPDSSGGPRLTNVEVEKGVVLKGDDLGSDAVSIAVSQQQRIGPMFTTEHKNSEHMQWEEVAKVMLEPRLIFDGRNIIADDIVNLGFKVERIGRKSGIGWRC